MHQETSAGKYASKAIVLREFKSILLWYLMRELMKEVFRTRVLNREGKGRMSHW